MNPEFKNHLDEVLDDIRGEETVAEATEAAEGVSPEEVATEARRLLVGR